VSAAIKQSYKALNDDKVRLLSKIEMQKIKQYLKSELREQHSDVIIYELLLLTFVPENYFFHSNIAEGCDYLNRIVEFNVKSSIYDLFKSALSYCE